MHPIVYYILFFLAVGAVGMALANRKAEPVVRRQRWLKYFTYIIFTGVVVLGIFYHFFQWVAWVIVVAALSELIMANFSKTRKSALQVVVSFIVFSLIATGFILFSISFHYSFLLFVYFQVLVFDGFCQITGQLFGKHQLAPKISPAKTWEGLAGGLFCCIVAAVMAADWVLQPYYKAALFGLLTGIAGFAGDLLASYYKRKTGIKDYSNWLPGQGGFLDRFDSFLLAGSVYFLLYITIFKGSFIFFVKQ